MSSSRPPRIVRLSARSYPILDEERRALAVLNPELVEIEGESDAETLDACRDADALMIIATYLRTPVVQALTRCKIISRLGIGVDKIDVEAATRQGIIVNNLPDVFTHEVSDHTLALLLAASRRIKDYDLAMRGGFRQSDERVFHRLSTQTVGLIGFGMIGRAVAKRCRAFDLRVLAYDPCLTPDVAAREGVTAADFDTILAAADYLCLLCPLLPSTRGMLAMPQFKKMKRTATLINTARGELVNEDDLAAALRDGVIAYAALDVFGFANVFDSKGFKTDHPLFGLKNVLFSPHMGAASLEAVQECRRRGVQAVADVLAGAWPEHPVNPDVKPWFPLTARPAL